MHRVTRRIYGKDGEGRRVLLCAPGDVITDEAAERIARLADPEPEASRGWWTLLERRDAPREAPPATPLERMKLAELRELCEAEGIDPGSANTRAEYVAAIEASRKAGTRKQTR